MSEHENKPKPRTLAEAFGYDPKAFGQFIEKKKAALQTLEEQEEKRIKSALLAKLAWPA